MTALLEVDGLTKSFGRGRKRHQVLHDVSFSVPAGRVVGIVGQSGSGKTTAVRCVLGLDQPDAGAVRYDGFDVLAAGRAQRRRFQTEVQTVSQDPYTSLDPRMRVEKIVGEPLWIGGLRDRAALRARALEALALVGLPDDAGSRFPRAFSGGQRQRIAIARALITRPRLLVCDEAVSALDVSVQAEILNLIRTMQRQLSLSVLFVAHDLAVVKYLCEHVVVMSEGRVVEAGSREAIYDAPATEYTRRLLAAVPRTDPAAERARRHARLSAGAGR
ncbi:ABC transporter ATP-binding protein [Pseudofrankia inefficax]|uniref:ABC transporter related protein n=1 Tax=Pseudofrankia inefficax (strain DSM 45817 / CECT 9037 / DDB 130130 / EuI1c) TaxID=298654 RepID=E3J7H0_PSEI1|nr:ABC transporter ATP-binding protein [Pseudofrankia inefficax]ADP79579.1 ABC transporter related protein [Pseudofrankia inefficax]